MKKISSIVIALCIFLMLSKIGKVFSSFTIEGDIKQTAISLAGMKTVKGSVYGNLFANGLITINGNVTGDISANGSFEVKGLVSGFERIQIDGMGKFKQVEGKHVQFGGSFSGEGIVVDSFRGKGHVNIDELISESVHIEIDSLSDSVIKSIRSDVVSIHAKNGKINIDNIESASVTLKGNVIVKDLYAKKVEKDDECQVLQQHPFSKM